MVDPAVSYDDTEVDVITGEFPLLDVWLEYDLAPPPWLKVMTL
jgi:hypothetical protein